MRVEVRQARMLIQFVALKWDRVKWPDDNFVEVHARINARTFVGIILLSMLLRVRDNSERSDNMSH